MVVVTTASSTEMLESIPLARIRRGLWIKHLRKEVEALRKRTNHLTKKGRIDDGKDRNSSYGDSSAAIPC
jgi:hypothetical protein